MKRGERTDETLDPTVERELEALDRALAGEPVDPDLRELAELATELRDERPEPRDRWGLEMDARAGAGFGSSRLRRRIGRGRGPEIRLRSALLPAGAVATAVVVAAVAITVPGGSDDEGVPEGGTPAIQPAPSEGGGGGDGDFAAGGAEPALRDGSQRLGSDDAAAVDPSNLERQGGASGRAGGGIVAEDSALPAPGDDRTAPGTSKRRQDRSALIALKTDTDEVRDVSDQAVEITESAGGVVRNSSLTEQGSRATAVLSLSIPTRELDSVLDQLTDLATVQSLSEGARDITRPFVSARDRLRDARAERTELLEALGNASGEEEVEAIRGQLRDVRREISRAEAAFDRVARRARTAEVSLRVEGSPDGGGWSLGDAADDALSALKTVAGVLLVAAAILAPIALLAAAIALIAIRVRHRRRERALDEGDDRAP